jgi:hypothetical protein
MSVNGGNEVGGLQLCIYHCFSSALTTMAGPNPFLCGDHRKSEFDVSNGDKKLHAV